MSTAQVQEELSEPLRYKTWILKVSIHCQGCKKKVHKILTNIPGVYSADIEIRQQKVIVRGNVEAETLLNKLIKSGKNAELWPENPEQKEKIKPAKPKNKEKQNDPQPNKEAGPGSVNGDKEIKPPEKAEKSQDSAKSVDANGRGAGDGELPANPGADTKVGEVVGMVSGAGQVGKESKSEGKLPETGSASNQSPPPVVLKKVDESEIGGEKSGGGGENGNGGKKGQSSNKTVSDEPPSVSPPASTTSVHNNGGPPTSLNHNGGPPPVSIPVNHNGGPPRHQEDQYQPLLHYYTPPSPVNGLSFNMAHPSSSYTASYYTAQPPNSYAYSHPGSGTEPPYPYLHMERQPQDFYSYPRQPLDSFEMFSDENPNGCSIS